MIEPLYIRIQDQLLVQLLYFQNKYCLMKFTNRKSTHCFNIHHCQNKSKSFLDDSADREYIYNEDGIQCRKLLHQIGNYQGRNPKDRGDCRTYSNKRKMKIDEFPFNQQSSLSYNYCQKHSKSSVSSSNINFIKIRHPTTFQLITHSEHQEYLNDSLLTFSKAIQQSKSKLIPHPQTLPSFYPPPKSNKLLLKILHRNPKKTATPNTIEIQHHMDNRLISSICDNTMDQLSIESEKQAFRQLFADRY